MRSRVTDIRSLVTIGLSLVCSNVAPAALDSTTPSTFVYAETTSPATPVYRQFSGTAWSSQASANTASSSIDWQVIRTSPMQNTLALATLSSDRGLRLQLWNGSVWDSASAVTTDCGVSATRAFDAAYEQASGELLVAYRKTTSTNIYYRSYTTATPGEQTFAAGLNTAPRWIGLTPMPGADTMVLLVATDTRLYGAVWDGSAFGNLTTLETSLPTTGFPCTAAASRGGAVTIAAWGTTSTNRVRYATWNGTAWSSVANACSTTGTANGIVLAAHPAGSEVLLTCLDAARDIRVCRWSGTAWGSATTVETSAGSPSERRLGLAYSPNGATALLAWHTSGQNALRYRTWDGSAWSATATGTNMGAETTAMELRPGPETGDISLAVRYRGSTGSVGDYNAYAQTGTATVNGTATGIVDDQVAGVTLPSAPTNAAGTTDRTYGNNATLTLAPGATKGLTAGNNFTLNLSAGTYTFTQITLGSSPTINANTAGGDISIILTNGNFTVTNSLTINNTGPGQVVVHVVSGNFDTKNNTNIDASVLAYNGNIILGNNASVDGALFATGNVTTGNNAVLTNTYQPYAASNARLALLRFTGSAMGGITACSSAVAGWNSRQNFSLLEPASANPSVLITRWHEVRDDE